MVVFPAVAAVVLETREVTAEVWTGAESARRTLSPFEVGVDLNLGKKTIV